MKRNPFAEAVVEDAALAWLEALGFAVKHGPDIAAGEPGAEREASYRDVVLQGRLRDALARLNPSLPPEALDDALRKITVIAGPSLIERNREFISCPLSNRVLAGQMSLQDLTRGYGTLASKYGVKVVHDEVVEIDADKRQVKTRSGATLGYDRAIVSPGP